MWSLEPDVPLLLMYRYAAALQFDQMRQDFGIPLYMKNETRHVSLSGLRHERLTPEAEQRFSASAQLAIGKNIGDSLAQAAPTGLPDLLGTRAGGNPGLYELLP